MTQVRSHAGFGLVITVALAACSAVHGDKIGGGGTGTSTTTLVDGGVAVLGVSFADALPAAPGSTIGSNGENVCGITKVDLQRLPAELLLVQDRSGSMLDPAVAAMRGTPPGPSKWQDTSDAIDAVVMQTQASILWGVKMFPLPTSSTCGVPDGVDVPIAVNNYVPVSAALQMFAPRKNNGTPTQPAVRAATAWMKTRTTPNPKYLLLATDGQPNCLNGDASTRGADDNGAVSAVADALTAGFPTFVVGIAVGTDADATLGRMADAGGRPRMADKHYYPVTSKDDLVAALSTIAGQVASCSLALGMAPPNANNVAVDFDGTRVPMSATDGWSFGPNNQSVVVNGSWCDKIKAGQVKAPQILFGCPGQPIPG